MDEQRKLQAQTLASINFILGVWLVISPYIFSYATSGSKWNQTVFGVAIVVFSAIRYLAPQIEWPSWLNAVTGLWLIIAPFALGYVSGVAYWNEAMVGILVAIFSLWNTSTHPRVYST